MEIGDVMLLVIALFFVVMGWSIQRDLTFNWLSLWLYAWAVVAVLGHFDVLFVSEIFASIMDPFIGAHDVNSSINNLI
jgi:hypothetical protein